MTGPAERPASDRMETREDDLRPALQAHRLSLAGFFSPAAAFALASRTSGPDFAADRRRPTTNPRRP